ERMPQRVKIHLAGGRLAFQKLRIQAAAVFGRIADGRFDPGGAGAAQIGLDHPGGAFDRQLEQTIPGLSLAMCFELLQRRALDGQVGLFCSPVFLF
ncbi:MAG: hypothetical protein ACO3BO_05660, partial [Anaerohalosphaeraceae bacterium]